jgi:hypothetical protein
MPDTDDRSWDSRPEANELFANIRAALPELQTLLESISSDWGYEDYVYRFYHQSWKVYRAQDATERVVEALRKLAPRREPDPGLNKWFEEIVRSGTGKTFEREHNARWLEVTRPMLEALFHARFFLEMICKYGKELERPPNMLPNGWAAVLYLYGLR